MKKRILSMMIAIFMVIGLVPGIMVPAGAVEVASGTTGDCTWTFDDATGTLTISGEGAMANYMIAQQPWYPYNSSLKKVVIESGVTSVGNNAFNGFDALTEIQLPDTLTKIGNNAIRDCSVLSRVEYWGTSAPTMGRGLFGNIDASFAVYVPETYEGDSFGELPVTISKTLVADPATPEAEQYYLTLYWGMSYTEELGYIVDKAPMVYDEALGLYTYALKETVFKGDGIVSMHVYDPDKKEIDSGGMVAVPSDTYSFSVDFTLQPERGISGLRIENTTFLAPPQWRNGHVVMIDSNNDNDIGKSDQYIQLNPENGIYTATVENMDAFDGDFFVLIDGVKQDVIPITIPTDGSTVIFTSDGNAFGYTIVDSEPTPTYVAEVNGTSYESIDDAIGAAEAIEGSTLKLLGDVEGGIVIDSGKFTLDLNGYKITSDSMSAVYISGGNITIDDSVGGGEIIGTRMFGQGILVENATCTIENGIISGASYGILGKNGNITINGGTVNGDTFAISGDSSNITINGGTISGNSGVNLVKGSLTINGGNISGDYCGVWITGGNGIIKGGIISGGSYGVSVSGYFDSANASATSSTCVIEGGQISGGEYGVLKNDNYYNTADGDRVFVAGGICTIKGGSFNTDPSEYVAAGYAVTLNETSNLYDVAVASDIAEVNGTSYDNIDDAINAAEATEGSTLKLLGDIEGGIVIDGGKFTLDLNGYTVFGTQDSNYNTYCVKIGNADVTIIDSSADKSGDMYGYYTSGEYTFPCHALVYVDGGNCTINGISVSSDRYGVYVNSGSCVITDGAISTNNYGVYVVSGSVTINGGTISGAGGVYAESGNVTVNGGNINVENNGVFVWDGSVTVNGGTVSGGDCGVNVGNGTCTIKDGIISGEIAVGVSCTCIIEGGNISGSRYGVSSNGGDLTVKGGNISGGLYGVFVYGDVLNIEDGTISGEKYGLYIDYPDVTATISGGSISGFSGMLAEGGIIHISGGTITGNGAESTDNNYGIILDDLERGIHATLTISGGTVTATGDYSYGVFVSGGVLNITGGSVSGEQLGLNVEWSNSSATVTGGTITGGDTGVTVTGNATCTIKGGSFNHDPSEYVAEGYAATLNSETNMYDVAVAPDIAEVNGTTYKSISDAIDAAEATENSILKLLGDVEGGMVIDSGKFTLDLNGYTVRDDSYGSALTIRGGEIIITDSSTAKTGTLIGRNSCVYIVNGTVTVNSGTISGDVDGIWGEDSNIIINGGTISGDGDAISGKDNNIIINGGSISSNYRSIYLANSSITVNGGDILGESFGIILFGSNCTIEDGMIGGGTVSVGVSGYYNSQNKLGISSTCIIKGGIIFGGTYCVLVQDYKYRDADGNVLVIDGGTCTIKGGSFNHDPSEYVAEGYAATLNGTTELYDVDEKLVTITFVDTGDNSYAPITMKYGESVAPLADPTRKGYTFLGWDKPIPNKMPSNDITITALWEAINYDIEVDSEIENGQVTVPENAIIGEEVTLTITPDEGYEIESVVVTDKDGKAVDVDENYSFEMPEGGVKVDVVFKKTEFKVLFFDYDGSLLGDFTVAFGEAATAPADPTREGYRFIGWDKEFDSIEGDLDITAIYEEKQAVTVAGDSQSYTYDKEAQAFAIDSNALGGFTVTYQQNGQEVTPVNAGEYDVIITRAEDGTYKKFALIIEGGLVITPFEVTPPTAADAVTYNGEAQTYGVASTENYTVTNNVHTDANEAGYEVVISLSDKQNTVWAGGDNKDITHLFFINRLDINKAVITLGTALVYNGEEQEQTVASVAVDGLTVTYKVENAKATNAGKYTLTVVGTGNFKGTAEAQFEIAIANLEPEIPEGLVATFGDTLADVALPEAENGKWTWDSADDEVGFAGKNAHKATFTPNDTNNYHVVESVDIVIDVKPDTSKIDELDITNATVENREDIVDVLDMITSDEAKEEYSELIEKLEELLHDIDVTNKIENIDEVLAPVDETNVNSDDKEAIEELVEIIEDLESQDTTDEEKQKIESLKQEIESLLEKIAEVEEAIDILDERFEDITSVSDEKANKVKAVHLKDDIVDILAENNLTDEERIQLEAQLERLEKILDTDISGGSSHHPGSWLPTVDTDTETESETETETESETETETESESEIVTESETETEIVTESETETEIVTESETETEIVTESETETEIVTESETETEIVTESETETEIVTESETETESVTESDTVTDDIGCELPPETETATEKVEDTETETAPAVVEESGNGTVVIVVVCVAVALACGGFALWWFVIRKKNGIEE